LAEGWEVQKVWACPYRAEILALIEVKTASGIEYYSAGSSEFGLLGQGTNDKSDKIKDSKPFGLLDIEKGTQFKQISVGHNFILAIDQND
jgi:alpha-tubulin suppressor-like RCC1 family protein